VLAAERQERSPTEARAVELGPDQEDLLVKLVEAEREVPREHRQPFWLSWSHNHPNPLLRHPGWPEGECVYEPDVQLLERAGLLHVTTRRTPDLYFVVSPAGHNLYASLQTRDSEPLRHLEKRVLSFISGDWFATRYPPACAKWKAAEELLWREDTEESLGTVGHLAREAMIEFADLLAKRFSVSVPQDRAKTVARIKAVVEHLRPQLGEKTSDFLGALIAYWGTVSDLVQRLEHAVSHEGSSLTLDDSRRVVFQTAIVFFEFDQACKRVRSGGEPTLAPDGRLRRPRGEA
jgi:hypothetical protein